MLTVLRCLTLGKDGTAEPAIGSLTDSCAV